MPEILEVKEENIAEIAALEADIFPDAWSGKSLRESLRNPQTIMLGAREAGRLAGYVIFYYVLDEGEIARIAVDESCRRRGAARALLDALAGICADRGISRWMLDVREHNQAAIAFYHSYGFVEDGIRKNFYTSPTENAILMSLELGR